LWLSGVRKMDLSARIAAIAATESWSAKRLDGERNKALRELAAHARGKTPFYAKRLPELPRDDADLLRWLAEVPPLTRNDLTDRGAEMRDPDPRHDAIRNASGGSSGQPVRFLWSREMAAASFALEERYYQWCGDTGDQPRVRIWGHPGDAHGAGKGVKRRLKEALLNDVIIDAFALDEAKAASIAARLHELQPGVVVGYASALHTLAQIALATGTALPRVNAVVASAEPLFESWRVTIAKAFSAPVFDRYGTREVGGVACEPAPGEHMRYNPLYHVIEALRPDGSRCDEGEEGDLHITVLNNHAQPFIRYAIGDHGALAGPVGDHGWPQIVSLGGRAVDVIRTPEGGKVLSQYLIHMVGVELNENELSAVQFEQFALDDLVIRYVRNPDLTADEASAKVDSMIEVMRPVLGPTIGVRGEEVDAIEKAPSGKLRYVISHVS